MWATRWRGVQRGLSASRCPPPSWRGLAFAASGKDGLDAAQAKVLEKLKGHNLSRIDDYSQEELFAVLALSHRIKGLYKAGELPRALLGKSVASIYQKRSTRTRVSTDTGMALLGGTSLFLGSEDVQLGKNESLRDTALVLSRFNSVILARVYGHKTIEELAQHSSVPVINALSDMHHPLQSLADYMTMQECFGELKGKSLAWVGDGNNVLHDLMLAAPPLGVDLRICTPLRHRPNSSVVARSRELAAKHGTDIFFTEDPVVGVKGSNVVVTDTWVSMGQEAETAVRMREFEGYRVNDTLMNHASPDAIFMHCLPRHPEEVSDSVFYSKASVVFQEAENRMYTVMAVLVAQIGALQPFLKK